MANALYPKWKEALIQNSADSDLDGSGTTGVFASLIDTGTYTYSASHEFYSDLSGVVEDDEEIGATKSFTDGVFDGADVTFTGATGNSAEAIVIYRKNAGANTTWRLVCYLDTGVGGLPVTPNSGDIDITWNASGIFQI